MAEEVRGRKKSQCSVKGVIQSVKLTLASVVLWKWLLNPFIFSLCSSYDCVKTESEKVVNIAWFDHVLCLWHPAVWGWRCIHERRFHLTWLWIGVTFIKFFDFNNLRYKHLQIIQTVTSYKHLQNKTVKYNAAIGNNIYSLCKTFIKCVLLF